MYFTIKKSSPCKFSILEVEKDESTVTRDEVMYNIVVKQGCFPLPLLFGLYNDELENISGQD